MAQPNDQSNEKGREMAQGNESIVVVVDGIQTVGVHNGIARVQFMRLGADGKPAPAVELLSPVIQVSAISQGLAKIGK